MLRSECRAVRVDGIVLAMGIALLAPPRDARAQQPPATAVQPAAASAPAEQPPAELSGPPIQFEQVETQVGDRAVQRFGMHLAITTKIVQSGQVAHESSADLRRQQQRTIDVLAVAGGRAVKARATFDVSRRQTPDDAKPQLAPLPIEGKSYLMSREGDKLTVTDLDGKMPPLEEFKLVSESLASVGQPNPLAAILAGRAMRVGQRVFVPREMAQALLGFGSPELAEVQRFELTLHRLASLEQGGAPVAVFAVAIDVQPEQAGEYAIRLNGEMAVEPATCRLASLDLAGPVQVSTVERTGMGSYEYTMNGQLRVATRTQFSTATAAK
jgi:hypothetical protein